jgi:hypothetical protein
MITMVGDREGDIYHLFAHRPANVHLLVRSAQPRTLASGGDRVPWIGVTAPSPF